MGSLIKKISTILVTASLSFTFVVSYSIAHDLDQLANAKESTQANENSPASTLCPEGLGDVHEEDYHYTAITNLYSKGILNGYEDCTFKSGDPINRAEALKIISEAFQTFVQDEYLVPDARPFQDIPLDAWHAKYIVQAKEKGMINGYENNTFKPWETINLAESLKMTTQSLHNYIEPHVDELFADVQLDAWFSGYFAYAKTRDLLNISAENNVFPSQEMTRGYFAEIIYRLKRSFEGYKFGKATFYGEVFHGRNTASGKMFDMYKMTAAHKTLPFGSIVEVTNLANGKSVQVEITDRGPYGHGRVIDLTSAAFKEISSLGRGIIYVEFKVISEPSS